MKARLIILVFVLAPCLFCQQPAMPRPPVGVPADATLFNGRWYAVAVDKVSWHTARDKCKRVGGQLAIVPDEATWKFIAGLTQLQVWLGATDERAEGQWKWVDGSEMKFAMWSDINPTNSGGSEHYLMMKRNGTWNDTPSEWDYYKDSPIVGYVCEWKAR
jgi:Lectin C-type domain